MKRFTATEKWDDPWFRKLSPASKLLWVYLTDKCDAAGVIDLDIEDAAFRIGTSASALDVGELGDRLKELKCGKLHIVKFVEFQYLNLSEQCPAHKPVFAALKKHGLSLNGHHRNDIAGVTAGNAEVTVPVVTESRMEPLELQIQEEPKAKVFQPTETQRRLNRFFKRRDSTKWSKVEEAELKALEPISGDDLATVERYYLAKHPPQSDYRRRDMITLLRNWNGELDRARQFKPATCY